MEEKIGQIAGQIWNLLNEEGAKTLTQLKKEIAVADDQINQGIGWLAREGKLDFEKKKNSVKFKLK